MANVTKKKLIQVVSRDCGVHPSDVKKIVQSFLDRLIDFLASGDRIEFRDFGIFEVVKRKSKIGRNPKKASVSIVIPECMVVKFTSGKKMSAMVKNITELTVSKDIDTDNNTIREGETMIQQDIRNDDLSDMKFSFPSYDEDISSNTII